MRLFVFGALLSVVGAGLGLALSSPNVSAAPVYACVGCVASPDGYPGEPAVVSFPKEPSFGNGECTGQQPNCESTNPCDVEGELEIKNITTGMTLYVKELGAGSGETELAPGASTTLTYGGQPIGCGNDIYIEVFKTSPGTPNRIAIAYYWFDCTNCGGN